MVRINKYSKKGHPKKIYPLDEYPHKRLGSIPMKISNKGKIVYAQRVPHNYDKDANGDYHDMESIERSKAVVPVRVGSFIRRHIFDTRFQEESEESRRKREYKEWMEENI